MSILAIDIGGTKFSAAVFYGDRMALRETRPTLKEGGREWMLDQIRSIAGDLQQRHECVRCGIGFGGPVNFKDQRVAFSMHVGGWGDCPLPAELKRALGIPCVMDNDANLGALGEYAFGAGVGCDPLLYVTISTGIGGGIVIGGQVTHGADSLAGEIGHTAVRPDGPECLCGARGCLERLCCGLWLERDYGKPAKTLLQDPAFVRKYVIDLALGLKNAIMLLNPARVVLGGGISKAGPALLEPLRAELRRQLQPKISGRLDVVTAALGDDSVLYGAYELAKKEMRVR